MSEQNPWDEQDPDQLDQAPAIPGELPSPDQTSAMRIVRKVLIVPVVACLIATILIFRFEHGLIQTNTLTVGATIMQADLKKSCSARHGCSNVGQYVASFNVAGVGYTWTFRASAHAFSQGQSIELLVNPADPGKHPLREQSFHYLNTTVVGGIGAFLLLLLLLPLMVRPKGGRRRR